MIIKTHLARLLSITLLASCLSLQGCMLYTLCSVITYPIFFLLTDADQIPDQNLPTCKKDEPFALQDDPAPSQNALANHYLKLICR